jgi:hypothetical protein
MTQKPVLIKLYAGALGNPKTIGRYALWVQGVGPLQMTSHEDQGDTNYE